MNTYTSETLVAGITEWVELESPSHRPDLVTKMMELTQSKAQALGLKTELRPLGGDAAPLLYVTNRLDGDQEPGVLILAHLDTVHPVGTLAENVCRIEGDRLYGPGVYDMKAGAYLALLALGELSAPGKTRLPVDFLFSPDEEIGSHASRASIEEFAANARYVLVTEPARPNGGKCVTARKGTGSVYLTVKGQAAHAGMQHEKGRSAIKEMAHQVLALEAMTDYGRGITVSVGSIKGGTVSNVVPSHCEAIVDFRVPDSEGTDVLMSKLKAMKAVDGDVQLNVDIELNRPPMPASEGTNRLLQLAQGCAHTAGFALEAAPMTGGGSDANFTAAMGLPTIDGLGADGDGAHTLNEYILVSTLQKRLAFWEVLLSELQ